MRGPSAGTLAARERSVVVALLLLGIGSGSRLGTGCARPAEAYEKLALLWDFVESEGCALTSMVSRQFHREDGEEMVSGSREVVWKVPRLF